MLKKQVMTNHLPFSVDEVIKDYRLSRLSAEDSFCRRTSLSQLHVNKELDMKDNSLNKLGGTCSILLGISYIVVAVIYLLLPPEQQDAAGIPPEIFLESLAQNPALYIAGGLVFALGSLLGVAAVLAISESVRSANQGWVRWTRTLAIIGFAVNAIDSFRRVSLDSARAVAYVKGDAIVKAVLAAPSALPGLDPQAWLRLGAVGLWVLVISLLALRGGTWPKSLAYLGIAVTIVYWLIVASNFLQIQSFTAIVAGVGLVILTPLWYIWLGLRLRKAG
jgi:hypothetical protein